MIAKETNLGRRVKKQLGQAFFRIAKVFGLRKPGYLNVHVQYRPDRYSLNNHLYQQQIGFYDQKDLARWNKGNYLNNAGDHTRFYFLNLCIDFLIEDKIEGDIAELGVYRGNSAFLLAKFARRTKKHVYLFDTFEGFDKKDLVMLDRSVSQEYFADTSLQTVKDFVGEENVIYIKGYFPESIKDMKADPTYSLIHIDCDLEKPMREALEYFYPRMQKGGFIIIHDHTSLFWDGAKRAIDGFFSDKPEFLIPIPDKSEHL